MSVITRGRRHPADGRRPDYWNNGHDTADYYESNGCTLHGVDHGPHRVPHPKGGTSLCHGWRALHRDITEVTARFPRPYLRGRKSNVIHRSAHTGTVTWFPDNFHKEGGVRVAFWDVKTACSAGARHLRNPDMLTADEVKTAQPVPVHHSNPNVDMTLCRLCFPRPADAS